MYIHVCCRVCFFPVDSISYKFKFMSQINISFGSGGMSLALGEAQFSGFIQYLKENVASLPIVRAVGHVGEQDDGVWVLNKTTQMDANGEVITDENQQYLWLDEVFSDVFGNVSRDQLIPHIPHPPNSDIFHRYEIMFAFLAVIFQKNIHHTF